MNKLKSLPKLASMGVGAIALSLSGIMLAPNNAAAAVCGFAFADGSPNDFDLPCVEGGKQVRDISIVGSPFNGGDAEQIEFEFLQPLANEHVFDAVYEAINPVTGNFDPVFEAGAYNYTVSYAVDILNDPEAFFTEVEIDSITVGEGATVTKDIFSDAARLNLIDTIVSTNGGTDTSINFGNLGLDTLYITDTIDVAEGAALEAYDNGFKQGTGVPEPGTILGLLAVGGLGLGLKRKKQS